MVKKIIDLVKYWGIINLVTKAYEKIIIDPKRYEKLQYANTIEDDAKHFSDINKSLDNNMPLSNNGKQTTNGTILYLTHQFYPSYQGGTEIFTRNMAIGMQALGYKVIVITLDYKESGEYTNEVGGIRYRTYKHESIDVIGFRYNKTPRGMLYKQIDNNNEDLHRFAEEIIDIYKPTFVHCTYPQPMISFLGKCYDRKIPYIITLTDFNIACHYATKVNKCGQFCKSSNQGQKCQTECNTYIIDDFTKRYANAEECLERANSVIVPSEFAAEVILKEFPDIKLWVIPHGIQEFKRGSFDTLSEVVEYAYIGKLSTIKGVYQLIEAFKEANIEKSRLTIYGTGAKWYIKKLEKLIGGDNRILIKGQIPHTHMNEVYSNTRVVVVPSLCYETYNYVVREAITAGCLVIGSDRGAIKEAITEETGWIVDMGSKISLIKALQASATRNVSRYKGSCQTLEEEILQYRQLYAMSIHQDDMEERKTWIQ